MPLGWLKSKIDRRQLWLAWKGTTSWMRSWNGGASRERTGSSAASIVSTSRFSTP